jgi:hypothetical protein
MSHHSTEDCKNNRGSGSAALFSRVLLALVIAAPPLFGQAATTTANLPRVVIPTSNRPTAPVRPIQPGAGILYPWRQNITATIFWIGEQPTQNNPTPNHMSSWDQKWAINFGGYDDPNPNARIADHARGEFRPKNFTPRLNPFYVALPYNDVAGWSRHKPEAAKVIPWFSRINPAPGKTVLKGRWVQIYNGKRSCYAQWEDCGPWVTDDYEYVFLGKPPKNKANKGAAIDISPSVRDYLDLQSGQKCHWRFVEDAQVPYGPWKKYGPATPAAGPATASTGPGASDPGAQQRYLEYLRKLRDEQYLKKSKSDLENGR